jgi:hypothetical protein
MRECALRLSLHEQLGGEPSPLNETANLLPLSYVKGLLRCSYRQEIDGPGSAAQYRE